MNKANNPHEIIVSGIHLELTAGLKDHVREKMERLFRHEGHIVRLKVELECDRKHDHEHKFIAKGHIVIHGPHINPTAHAADTSKPIDLLSTNPDQALPD